jgi:hypothetical protein
MQCRTAANRSREGKSESQAMQVLWYRNFVTMMLYRRNPDEFDLQGCISDYD